jgi:hypothetical protein
MKHSIVRSSFFVLVVCGLLAGAFFAGRLLAGPKAVQARSQPDPVSPSSIDSSYSCYVNNVAVYENRIHVRCDAPYQETGIWYFAYPTDSSTGYTANRLLAVGQTAGVLGYPVWVYFDLDPDSNPPGCNTGDCRLLTGISMVGLP